MKLKKCHVVYSSICAASILLSFFILQLWTFDLTIPIYYGGDAIQVAGWVKSIIDHGWYYVNSSVGMPFGGEMYDYPGSDLFNFFIIKIFSLFTNKFGLVMNLYFLLGFPLTALSASYVMRYFKLSYFSSFVGGILFAFLPYHFFRGEYHIFLSFYWIIPVVIFMLYYVFTHDHPPKKRLIALIIICLITSSSGIYYAFFTCFLLLMIGLIRTLQVKDIRKFIIPAILTAVIGVGCLINLSPYLLYSLKHGKDTTVAHSYYGHAEIMGLKISQLLLPVTDHRLPFIAELKNKYNQIFPLINENSHSTLGIIGSIGFIALIFSILIRSKNDLLLKLGKINILLLLLGTVGGIGSIASFVVPEIRGYNRICVFIGFVSLVAFFIILEKIKYKTKLIQILTYALILIIGILDQTTENFAANPSTISEFKNDQKFVASIESMVPKGSMIFQLPYLAYPESQNIVDMTDYSLSKGYLHSKNLRWSYGAMKGRFGDLWQQNISSKPLSQMIEQLSYVGFQGIYIDRYGFQDRARQLETELQSTLHTTPIISDNRRLSFFPLKNYINGLNLTNNEFQKKQSEALYPLIVQWNDGFYDQEQDSNHKWRWSSKEADLLITNYSNKPKKISVAMGLVTGYSDKSKVIITGLIDDTLTVSSEIVTFQKKITISPGVHKIHFKTTTKQLVAPGDSRNLFFRVLDPTIKEEQ